MNVFARSWSLLKSTLAVLSAEKSFIAYPLLAGVFIVLFSMLILGGGAFLVATHPELEQALVALDQGGSGQGEAPWWVYAVGVAILWVFLLATSFTANFFLTALTGGALMRLRGGDPTFGTGLAIARQRAGRILGYSAIAATVGLLLSLLRGRDQQGGVGALLSGLGGLAWGVATFLVIPVLAAKDIGPISAVKESGALLRRTWGEQLSVSVGLGLITGLPLLLLIAGTFGGVAWAGASGQTALAVAVLIVGVTLVALMLLVSATLNAIVRGAVYLYADTGQVPSQFDAGLISHAMKARKSRASAI
jgi:hypothetical protein